ncbi:DUF3572 domain-containing protein [Parasphingopyxis marina]|uniref:DUF3572 domain-containing protein n=1 Tax=Parasphingopyxis marina TaxID=2761622 RepID=UPI002E2CD16C|nr:DUF3572 domain-containing protein [Parasphingopyxis marina]
MTDTNAEIEDDATTLALRALIWTLSDERRADRLLALTGLTAERLREGIAEPSMQSAILAFLENHEPDLIACADAIGAAPGALIEARRALDA